MNTFDKQLAIECAQRIDALYRGELKPTIDERTTDTQVLIQREGGRTFVTFPGTASFKDGYTDIRAAKVDWSSAGKVHAGFRDAWLAAARAVMDQLAGSKHLIISGHSLGGALATLCVDASHGFFFGETRTRLQLEAAYTFGSPRVGNGAFARFYNTNYHDSTFRIVCEGDPVVRVPWMFGTYRHVGTRVFLGKNGLEVNPPLWRGVVPEFETEHNAHRFVRFSHHAITHYLARLRNV